MSYPGPWRACASFLTSIPTQLPFRRLIALAVVYLTIPRLGFDAYLPFSPMAHYVATSITASHAVIHAGCQVVEEVYGGIVGRRLIEVLSSHRCTGHRHVGMSR